MFDTAVAQVPAGPVDSLILAAESQALAKVVKAGRDRREVRAATDARLLRVSPQTIRNWVRRGILEGRVDESGHIMIPTKALSVALELDRAMPYLDSSAPDFDEEDIIAEIDAHRSDHR